MQAFGRVLDDQQNPIFRNGAVRPDRFPSDTFPLEITLRRGGRGEQMDPDSSHQRLSSLSKRSCVG